MQASFDLTGNTSEMPESVAKECAENPAFDSERVTEIFRLMLDAAGDAFVRVKCDVVRRPDEGHAGRCLLISASVQVMPTPPAG